ncbi:NAD(P)/FAD-dependent oxidoreductase [Haloplanus natans]|uniref:NAD(P)/FAD-dependent oxidoreductase n=1 Tax=Haloplanus natans TaxID=376171 RepID=UPI000677AFA5|nr:NAD(P)/FAD-dependent oxidoreductase [Haloplanus natans]
MEHVDVAVVGGGPAGTSAAHAAAEAGASALVLEKGVPRADREGLGPDSTDAAGILDYWVDIMGIHPDEFPDDVLLSELDRATFVGPNESCVLRSTGIESSYDAFGYTFHRAKFDDWLRERATDAGADYRVGVSVKSVETTPDDDPRHTLRLADGDAVSADYLILADGPQRTVTNRVLDSLLPFPVTDHLGTTTANHIAYQEHRRLPAEVADDLRGAITFWWGYIPGHTAYPWIFPNDDDVARIGLTMPIGLDLSSVPNRGAYPLLRPDDETVPGGSEYLRRLLEREYGDRYDVPGDFPLVEGRAKSKGTETYPISSTRPVDSPVEAGIAVVGGAMGTTSAFHEGGDHTAVRTGRIAGELAGAGDLSGYNTAWKAAIGDEILRNVTMADMVRDYGPADWDNIFRTARKMLADTDGYGMFEKTFAAGWDAMKLLVSYRWNKRRNRDFVSIHESDYVY